MMPGRGSVLRRLTASALVRNILAVASGTAAAQVIVVVFSPLITRIYGPEVFGLQGVFLSLVAILSPVIALRYPMAIITATSEDEALRLGRLSLLIAAGIAGALWLVLLAGGQTIPRLLGAEGLGALILFLPLALFSVAVQDVMNFRAARLNAFKLVGKVEVLQAFLTNLARVLGGLVAPVAAMLVGVTSLAPAVKAAMLRLGADELRRPVPGLTRGQATALLKSHRDFPIYRMPTDVLNALSQSAPVLLLAALFSPAAAGLYVLARSVINLPINIVGLAVGNVLYARLAELGREGRSLFPLVARATLFQLLLPGAGLAAVSLLFPDLFAVVFGQDWRMSGEFAQWMSLWVICRLVNIPSVRALPVIRQQRWHLLFNGLIFLGGITGLYAGHWIAGTALGAVIWFSVAVSVICVIQITTYLAIIRNHDRKTNAHG